MKKSVLILLATGTLLLSPLSSASSNAGETCARSPQDVNSSPILKETMKTFGGASGLFGSWKLSGLAGVFAKVTVTLTATRTSFSVVVDENKPNEFWLCSDPDEPGVFRMRVQDARDAANALILIKAREPNDSVMVAAASSKWKFMKFKRRSSDD